VRQLDVRHAVFRGRRPNVQGADMSSENQRAEESSITLAKLNTSYRDPKVVNAILAEAAYRMHLVSPATAIGALPEGFSLALCTVYIDVEKETYPQWGKDEDEEESPRGRQNSPANPTERRSLKKEALDRISLAAGISWDHEHSRRMDDGKDPHFAHYRAVGYVTLFDGTRVALPPGEKIMDLREGSDAVEIIRKQAKFGRRRDKTGDSQIAELRQHIYSHAVTKARLRAVRSLGIRISYTRIELDEPFVIARLMATGETDDPELRRELTRMRMGAALGIMPNMWGPIQQSPKTLGRSPVKHDEPSKNPDEPCHYCGSTERTSRLDFVVHCQDPRCIQLGRADVARETSPRGTPPPPNPAGANTPAAASGPPQARAAGAGAKTSELSGFRVPPGKGTDAGKPIEHAGKDTLVYWCDWIACKLQEGRTPSQYVASDTALVEAMRAELKRREDEDTFPSSWDR
jgi:hypothetical protein